MSFRLRFKDAAHHGAGGRSAAFLQEKTSLGTVVVVLQTLICIGLRNVSAIWDLDQ